MDAVEQRAFSTDLERTNGRRSFHDDQQWRKEIGFPGG